MIKSCKQCKKKCCKIGPGPYKKMSPQTYLDAFGTPEEYNIKCSAFKKGKCSIWNKPNFPIDCRVYVCTTRNFSKKELDLMKKVNDFNDCKNCGRDWAIGHGYKGGFYYWECEGCGEKWRWERPELLKKGRK